MARKLDTFPTGGGRRYEQLDEWLDGSVWELHEGEDFPNARAVRSALAAAARRRGQRVRTRLSGEDGRQALVVQCYTPPALPDETSGANRKK